MAYRSFTPLSTRKSPAFRGKSLQLDGISDFIDLQGEYCGAYRHASYRSTANPNTYSDFAHPCSWSFWIKFPQSTIDDVLANHSGGGDMKHFIIKMHAANGEQNWYSSSTLNGYWSGAAAGLAADGSGNVRFAGARGFVAGDAIQQRAIRRSTSSTVNANTWYNVIFVWTGSSSISGIKIFVNGTEQNLAAHYPVGASSGEYSGNEARPRWYSYPWAPNISIPNLENIGAGTAGGNVSNYLANAEHTFACYIGKNQSDYTAMTIHDAAFWAKTALDTDDASGIWSRQNINLTQYHVNTNDAGGSNVYHQGEDGHATVPDIGIIAKFQNLEITLTSGLESKTYLFANGNSPYNTFGETGYGIIAGQNANANVNGKIYVGISSTTAGSTFSQTKAGTRWLSAINALHNGLTATLNGAAGFISITQDQGGWHMSSSPITYSPESSNVFNLTTYVNASTGLGPPSAFDTSGIDRLHAVFKFRGKRNDQSLSNSLQSTDNRISEYNENTSNTPGVNSIDPSTNRTEHELNPLQSWNMFLNYLPYSTLPALNNGGLWVTDIPGDTQ